METEAGFIAALEAVAYYTIHEERLTLLNAEKHPVARFEAVYFN